MPENNDRSEVLQSGAALTIAAMRTLCISAYNSHIAELLYGSQSICGSYDFYGISKYIKPIEQFKYEITDTSLP